MHSGTLSQLTSHSNEDVCSEFLTETTSLAAAFNTDWRQCANKQWVTVVQFTGNKCLVKASVSYSVSVLAKIVWIWSLQTAQPGTVPHFYLLQCWLSCINAIRHWQSPAPAVTKLLQHKNTTVKYADNTDIPCGPMQWSRFEITSDLVHNCSLGNKIPRTMCNKYLKSSNV